MEFHTSTCQVISITNNVKPIIGKYKVHDHIMEHVYCAKYLGVYIDSKLAFSTHVNAFVKNANSTRAFLARNIPRCCRKVMQMAYTNYIRPTVEYASPVWDPNTKRNANKIEMVQRRCSRYVTGNFYRTSSVTSLLNYRSRPTLEERRRQYRLAMMYRIHHVQVDFHWQSFLTKTSSCTRGHSCRLLYRFVRIMSMPPLFFLALAKTGITLPSIQLMHHPMTSLPGSWGMTMPRYLSFFFFFNVLLCFVLTSPPPILCVYLQTFEAALFWKKKKERTSFHMLHANNASATQSFSVFALTWYVEFIVIRHKRSFQYTKSICHFGSARYASFGRQWTYFPLSDKHSAAWSFR